MDTKWRNRKKGISFAIFFLGVSLTLGGITGILRDKPGSAKLWQVSRLLQTDYQENGRFRDYMAGRFWNFLAMATGDMDEAWWGYDGNGYWGGYIDSSYDGGYDDGALLNEVRIYEDDLRARQEGLEDLQEAYQELLEMQEELKAEGLRDEAEEIRAQAEAVRSELESAQEELESWQRETGIYSGSAFLNQETEEEDSPEKLKEEKERKERIARSFHERIKADKNLLYTVSYDGKVLYTNADQPDFAAEGDKITAPEGYNFLLYFDGEKVRLVKDGQELDVYGDGYYRERENWQENSWYVPGYRNIPVEEDMKKARILMAAAREPVLYREGNSGSSDSGQSDNALYWMNYNRQANRSILQREAGYLTLGLILLLLAFLLYTGVREGAERIARLQGKIWMECKVLLLLGMLYIVFLSVRAGGLEFGWWQELRGAYYYDYGRDTLPLLAGEMLRSARPEVWVLLFWGGYLIRNDLRYNKKPWRQSLAGKIGKSFSVKALSLPLSGKLARRSRLIFALAAVYGLVMALAALVWMTRYGKEPEGYRWSDAGGPVVATGEGGAAILALLAVLGAALLVAAVFRLSAKNMETARDMEAVSGCISEIRNGNYAGNGADFSGHDLEKVMEELEDIRQGMEKAVEEQMKSQRMKVELIANVSHDIKTPLTSIISYVQFLKQEEELPEHVKDYVRILDEKSQRLKNMVQDVFAVSKAASGELPINMEELDFGKLLRQTLADMEEEIGGSHVSFRTQLPEEPVMILADGQRMYRVFQNLFQNAIKYSLKGSRVYVTLEKDGELAVASVKNASLMELKKDMDFAERFTRGDESRSDGGSGLGLSIAQTFTEACGGTFTWETDADLFVVRVSFRQI